MGGLRTGEQTRSLPGRAYAGPGAGDDRPSHRRRWAVVAAYLLSGVVLCAVYARLSQTYTLNSDSANILLMGSDLLHGNLLLHGWYMSDVSFYPTELPQYALLESFLGMRAETAHIAAGMTYALALLCAVMLARSGSSGRQRLIRTLIAAGIMLAPQLGLGVFAMDLSVGHIGTAVPLLLIWLLLDRADRSAPRWSVPVLVAILLAWVQVADQIVYLVGIGPLGIACAARVIQGWFKTSGSRWRRIAAQWYYLSLGAASVAATGLAWVAEKVLSALGGYTVARLPFHLTPWSDLHNNWPALWKVLEVFGANYTGLSGVNLALAFLHLVSVALVALALARVARRFFRVSLVDQILAIAIVLNVLLYLFTNASDLAAHEVAIIVPYGAALVARVLVVARDRAPVEQSARPGDRRARRGRVARLVRVATLAPVRRRVRLVLAARMAPVGRGVRRVLAARPVRLAGFAAGILVLAGYAAGLGYEITAPAVPAANTTLATWLLDHHLTYGLSGYWTSSSVTLNSDNQVQVRALMQFTMHDDLWMSNQTWYDPQAHYANFIVLDSTPGYFSHWEPLALIKEYFGTPARIYHTGPYTILVWNRNLLASIPGNLAIQGVSP
jgi:hypothetical protein